MFHEVKSSYFCCSIYLEMLEMDEVIYQTSYKSLITFRNGLRNLLSFQTDLITFRNGLRSLIDQLQKLNNV